MFADYAQFYDTLYAEKDYEAECDYLAALFARYRAAPVQAILDLGCGTGGHAIPLARRGFAVTGVDRSEAMLEQARAKAGNASVKFALGDLRTLRLDSTFDAAIAMFAVMGYQTSNDDLLAAFRSARRHLPPGGLFVFDGWHGPAVLAQRPGERIRRLERGGERVIRLAVPALDEAAHTVEVNYTVLRLNGDRLLGETREVHRMRYLFTPEVDLLCRLSGFALGHACAFLQPDRAPGPDDWNATWVARAV